MTSQALNHPPFAASEFTSGDVRLHYFRGGQGHALVVLAGGPGLASDWYWRLVQSLAAEHDVVLLEQRGVGGSTFGPLTPETFTLAHYVADVEALRAHLGLETLSLLGHSWGAMLGMAYAACFPQRVSRLVLISPGGPDMAFYPRFQAHIQNQLLPNELAALGYWSSPERVQAKPKQCLLEAWRLLLPGYLHARESMPPLIEDLTMDGGTPGVYELAVQDLAEHYDLREGLRAFAGPVSVIQGEQDGIGLGGTREELRAALPQAHFTLLDACGHWPWYEQPQAFFTALQEVLVEPEPVRRSF